MIGILLDNGHGDRNHTYGKRSPDGTLIEGEFNREIVNRLAPALTELGFDVRIIVPEPDIDVPLATRVARANKIVKDNPNIDWYFISIHVNAGPGKGWSDASGFSVWIAESASEKSKKLAATLQTTAEKMGLQGNRYVPKCKYWTANFYVVSHTVCPAVLTENLFQTNKQEVEFLKSERGKETIVNLHIAAICEYFGIPCGISIG